MSSWPMRHVSLTCSEWPRGCCRTGDTCQVQASTKPGLQHGGGHSGPTAAPTFLITHFSPCTRLLAARGFLGGFSGQRGWWMNCHQAASYEVASIDFGCGAETWSNRQMWELRKEWKSVLPGNESVLGLGCVIYVFISNKSITAGHGICLKH